MRAIYKRELRSYFHSMIGYVFIAFLVAYTGIYFLAYNLNYGYPYFSYVLSGILFVYLVAIPILTMRCFAEDKKNKTDQMLLTAPVSLFEIVLGKYLAMVTITAVPCVIYLIFPLIIKAQGTAYIKVDYLAILVFFLLGCVYYSIGIVCLFIDRKCDHCGNRRIRYPASDLSLERHPELYPFGSMGKCMGSCGVVDAGRTCSLEYDEKCRDQRGTGADRTGRNTDYLLCKENSV